MKLLYIAHKFAIVTGEMNAVARKYLREDSSLYKLLLTGRKLILPKGQVVSGLEDRSRLFLIKKGYVKRYLITKDGELGIQVIYGPNDIFPLTPVYQSVFEYNVYSGPEQYYYESMTDIEIFSISQDDLLSALEKDSSIYKDLFYAAGLRLNSYIHRLESMSLRAANRKVAHQLMYLATIFGRQENDGIVIQLPLTHQSLGAVLNLARETVTHCLTRLQEKNVITSERHVKILDVEQLKKEAHWR